MGCRPAEHGDAFHAVYNPLHKKTCFSQNCHGNFRIQIVALRQQEPLSAEQTGVVCGEGIFFQCIGRYHTLKGDLALYVYPAI